LAKGTAQARDASLEQVKMLMRQPKSYVQVIADGSPDQAEAIILSASFDVHKVTARQKQVWHVEQGASRQLERRRSFTTWRRGTPPVPLPIRVPFALYL
jgi:hypothetical protein